MKAKNISACGVVPRAASTPLRLLFFLFIFFFIFFLSCVQMDLRERMSSGMKTSGISVLPM